MRKILLVLLALAGFASGCGNAQPITDPTGVLYVLDNFNQAVYSYSDIGNLNGALDPQRTISGDRTLIRDPASLAVDSRRDILYVADSSSDAILAFIPGSTTDGNITPRRTYPGINEAGAMFYNIQTDVLYVVDLAFGTIQVWDGISGLPDGATATRTITLGYDASGIFVDNQRNLLYVGAPDFDIVNVYVNASTLATTQPPPVNRTIEEATPSPSPSPFANGFDELNSLTMNIQNDILFIAESQNPSIEIFNQASTLNGVVPTDRVLTGASTGLTLDMNQIIFLENVLYVVLSRTNVGVWDGANTLDGDVAPNRNIQVNGATEIVGIAVDLAH